MLIPSRGAEVRAISGAILYPRRENGNGFLGASSAITGQMLPEN